MYYATSGLFFQFNNSKLVTQSFVYDFPTSTNAHFENETEEKQPTRVVSANKYLDQVLVFLKGNLEFKIFQQFIVLLKEPLVCEGSLQTHLSWCATKCFDFRDKMHIRGLWILCFVVLTFLVCQNAEAKKKHKKGQYNFYF